MVLTVPLVTLMLVRSRTLTSTLQRIRRMGSFIPFLWGVFWGRVGTYRSRNIRFLYFSGGGGVGIPAISRISQKQIYCARFVVGRYLQKAALQYQGAVKLRGGRHWFND